MWKECEAWVVWYVGIVDHQSGDSGILIFRVFCQAASKARTKEMQLPHEHPVAKKLGSTTPLLRDGRPLTTPHIAL